MRRYVIRIRDSVTNRTQYAYWDTAEDDLRRVYEAVKARFGRDLHVFNCNPVSEDRCYIVFVEGVEQPLEAEWM